MEKALIASIERYRCNHYRCDWEGVLIYSPQNSAQKVTSNSHLIQGRNLTLSSSLDESVILKPPEGFASEQDLRGSLERNEFVLYYQSSFDIETRSITGVEALLRWQHPERGLIYPAAFIPLANDNDFIFALGQWMLDKSCSQVLQWHEKGLYPLKVSVNLSGRQFYQPNLVETITQVLGQTGLKPNFFEIEVDESEILQHLDLAATILKELQQIGIGLTIDNFGVGSMPRRYLRRMALTTLKLDQSLIRNLKPETEQVEVIRSFVRLAQSLNLDVAAHGVETREQLYLLQLLCCKSAQGYLFDAPLPVEDATEVLEANWLERQENLFLEKAENSLDGL